MLEKEEIYEMVIGKMKEKEEEYLGKKVKNDVVNVNEYLKDDKRKEKKDDGKI